MYCNNNVFISLIRVDVIIIYITLMVFSSICFCGHIAENSHRLRQNYIWKNTFYVICPCMLFPINISYILNFWFTDKSGFFFTVLQYFYWVLHSHYLLNSIDLDSFTDWKVLGLKLKRYKSPLFNLCNVLILWCTYLCMITSKFLLKHV